MLPSEMVKKDAEMSDPAKAGPRGAKKGVLARKDGRLLRRMTVYLPTELARKLAVRCAEQDLAISDAIAEAIERYLVPEDKAGKLG